MKWKEDWVTLARELIREEFDKRYANRTARAKDTDAGASEEDEPVHIPPKVSGSYFLGMGN